VRRRRSILGSALPAALVSGLALIIILGLLSGGQGALAVFADFLLLLVAVVAAFAVLIGVFNLLVTVHLRRWLRFQRGWFYSLITILSALGVVLIYAFDKGKRWTGDLKNEQVSPRLFQVVQVTLESALAGLILFFLVYAAYRLMRSRVTWTNALFTTVILISLIGWIKLERLSGIADLRQWIFDVPVTAGTRGLLIGIGLGTVTAGIRLLLAQDRLYGQPSQPSEQNGK
jgi:hypothetical protein